MGKKMSLRLGVYTLLLASLVLLAQQRKADARKSVKKGLSNAIDLGPSYSSHHKAERKLSQLANIKNTPHNSTNAFTNHTSIKSANLKTAVARDAAKKVKNVKVGRKKLDKSRKKMQRMQKKLTREKPMRSKLEKP